MEVGEVRPATEADFDRLLMLATESTDTQGWELATKKSHCTVWTKANDISDFKMIMLSTTLDIAAETPYNMLHDSAYRRTWDKNMMETRDLCFIDPNNDIGYYQVKSPSPMRNRDFVTQRSWTKRNGVMMIMNHSVFHKDAPPRKNVIRGTSYYTGYVMQRINDSSCHLYYISQSSIGGRLPAWLVNKLTTVLAPKVVQRLHKAAKGYPAWKKKNNPDFMPWKWPGQITGNPIDWDDVSNTGYEMSSNPSEADLEMLDDQDMELEVNEED